MERTGQDKIIMVSSKINFMRKAYNFRISKMIMAFTEHLDEASLELF